MPFDPSIPATNAEATSAMFRDQFNGLKDLIDAIATVGSATVDAVNTLPPGDPASVNVTVTGDTLHFTFDLPQGADGATGNDGAPGEVSLQQLDDAIATTSANSNGVSTLTDSYADPDMEAMRQKINELIEALRR